MVSRYLVKIREYITKYLKVRFTYRFYGCKKYNINNFWEKTFGKKFINEGERKILISLYCHCVHFCINFTQYVQFFCQKLRSFLNEIIDFANITKNGWIENGGIVLINEDIPGTVNETIKI